LNVIEKLKKQIVVWQVSLRPGGLMFYTLLVINSVIKPYTPGFKGYPGPISKCHFDFVQEGCKFKLNVLKSVLQFKKPYCNIFDI